MYADPETLQEMEAKSKEYLESRLFWNGTQKLTQNIAEQNSERQFSFNWVEFCITKNMYLFFLQEYLFNF